MITTNFLFWIPLNFNWNPLFFSFKKYSKIWSIFFFFIFLIFEVLLFLNPYFLGDPENFSIANIISTPEHIVPEWYFLFAYAILRCVPKKGLGVIRILSSVFILLIPILIATKKELIYRYRRSFNHITQIWFWIFLAIFIIFFLFTCFYNYNSRIKQLQMRSLA